MVGLQRPVRARADGRARVNDPRDTAGIGNGDPLAPVDAEGLFLTVRASAAADSRVKEVVVWFPFEFSARFFTPMTPT